MWFFVACATFNLPPVTAHLIVVGVLARAVNAAPAARAMISAFRISTILTGNSLSAVPPKWRHVMDNNQNIRNHNVLIEGAVMSMMMPCRLNGGFLLIGMPDSGCVR